MTCSLAVYDDAVYIAVAPIQALVSAQTFVHAKLECHPSINLVFCLWDSSEKSADNDSDLNIHLALRYQGHVTMTVNCIANISCARGVSGREFRIYK